MYYGMGWDSGSTEWISGSDFVATGSFTNTPTATDLVMRSVGDVEIGPNGAGGTYTVTTPYLRAAAGRDMTITNSGGDMLVAAPAMSFDTGTTEDYSAVRIGSSIASNSIEMAVATGDLNYYSDNNMLITGQSSMTWTTTNAITFTATKGDILFRSTSVSNPGTHDVVFTSTNGDIFVTAAQRIEHRQVS